jgi:hypothetical protein
MIKFVLKIFNLNGSSLQIRSKQRTSGASTKQCGTSFELPEFQFGIIKQASNMRMHKPLIHIVNHDHFLIITWFGTHIIVRGSKSSNFGRSTFKLKIQLFVFTKKHAKQFVLIPKGILKLDDSQRKTLGGWIITYIRVRVGDVSWRLAHEAKASEVACLAFGLLILLWPGGVVAREVEVVEGSTRLRYHLLELLLLLLVPEVILLAITLVTGVVPVVVVVLVGGIKLLPLGVVGDEVGGVAASKQPLGDLLLSLWNLCKVRHFLASRAISSSRMLLYCSSEAAAKEDKVNSKADESVVLVG